MSASSIEQYWREVMLLIKAYFLNVCIWIIENGTKRKDEIEHTVIHLPHHARHIVWLIWWEQSESIPLSLSLFLCLSLTISYLVTAFLSLYCCPKHCSSQLTQDRQNNKWCIKWCLGKKEIFLGFPFYTYQILTHGNPTRGNLKPTNRQIILD